MIESLRILLVEDSPTDATLVMRELRRASPSVEFERVEDEAAMRSALSKQRWDAVISDWSLPKFSARAALAVVQASGLDLPFIIVSGTIGEELAVEAMRAGAHDYVLKDHLTRLAPAVEREIRDCKEREVHRRQEARFRALIEKSSEAILITLLDGSWSYASPAADALFATALEHQAKGIVDFVHPEDRAALLETMRVVRAAPGGTVFARYRIVRADGSIRWVETTSTNMLGDPAIAGVVTNMRDVTERKIAAEALRLSETRFARLSESGIIGVVFADVFGKTHDANDTYLQMLGYARDEIGDLRWSERTPPEWASADRAAVERLQSTGVSQPWEKELLRKDGSRVPVLIGAAMLDYPNCIVFAADLTIQKRAEAALRKSEDHLRQAQKMEAVGRLAGGVAHDFNNVLSVILSYSELLCAELKPEDPMRDDIDQIRVAGKRAADLTRQLLMFSRQQVLEPRILDVNDILAGLDKMLPRLLGEDIEIVSSRAPRLGTIKADPSSIEQVIMNLVVNARDAMPTGGKLTIETADVVLDEADAQRVGAKKTGPHVEVSVTDTGIGMDASTQQHMFEPFYTTKSKDKGTGLGLSTVFGIVNQSGGTVSVVSEVGKGTTFRIYLPCEGGARVRLHVGAEQNAVGGSETILLVEDEEQVRAVARGILRKNGYNVMEARSPSEAVLLCEQHPGTIDLLLSDVVMPNMSGPELALRLQPRRPQMKVLFMSGYTDDSMVRHGILNSDIAFLQKPLTPVTLARKVRSVLDAA